LTARFAGDAQFQLRREPFTAVGTSAFLSHEAGTLSYRSQQACDGGTHADILERASDRMDSDFANLLHRQQTQQRSQGRQEDEEDQTLSMPNYANYFGHNPATKNGADV
jgi:hypothetical protein